MILAAAERFHTVQPGITSWHCFSAGAHYDPSRVGFGPLVGVDEHLLAPGAGFAEHAHHGVEIVSWVLAGELRHRDDQGRSLRVGPGQALWQSAGSGIRHSEANDSGSQPLRFVQFTWIGDVGEPAVAVEEAPIGVAAGVLRLQTASFANSAPASFGFVVAGSWLVGAQALAPGDALAVPGAVEVSGSGQLLVWAPR
jgi:hypothetical protein